MATKDNNSSSNNKSAKTLLNDFVTGLKLLRSSAGEGGKSSAHPTPLPRDQRVTRQNLISLAKSIHKEITTCTSVNKPPSHLRIRRKTVNV